MDLKQCTLFWINHGEMLISVSLTCINIIHLYLWKRNKVTKFNTNICSITVYSVIGVFLIFPERPRNIFWGTTFCTHLRLPYWWRTWYPSADTCHFSSSPGWHPSYPCHPRTNHNTHSSSSWDLLCWLLCKIRNGDILIQY